MRTCSCPPDVPHAVDFARDMDVAGGETVEPCEPHYANEECPTGWCDVPRVEP